MAITWKHKGVREGGARLQSQACGAWALCGASCKRSRHLRDGAEPEHVWVAQLLHVLQASGYMTQRIQHLQHVSSA